MSIRKLNLELSRQRLEAHRRRERQSFYIAFTLAALFLASVIFGS